jgi:hypothetical protein
MMRKTLALPKQFEYPLNEDATYKIRHYRADYNNRPSNDISFMSTIPKDRKAGYIVNYCAFSFYKLIGKLTSFYNFRSSTSVTYQWTLPLPPCGVHLKTQGKSGQHPHQGCSFTYQLKY